VITSKHTVLLRGQLVDDFIFLMWLVAD